MANSFKKILLGEGAVYADYGEPGELLLGFVRGGSFNDNYALRHIEIDGKKGDVKGDAVVETVRPVLEFNAMQMESELFEKYFVGMNVADATGIKTITRDLVIEDTDYLTNFAFVGATKEGKEVVVKVLNALAEGQVTLTMADKSEVEIAAMFVGNYLTIADTTAPYEIILDETV